MQGTDKEAPTSQKEYSASTSEKCFVYVVLCAYSNNSLGDVIGRLVFHEHAVGELFGRGNELGEGFNFGNMVFCLCLGFSLDACVVSDMAFCYSTPDTFLLIDP